MNSELRIKNFSNQKPETIETTNHYFTNPLTTTKVMSSELFVYKFLDLIMNAISNFPTSINHQPSTINHQLDYQLLQNLFYPKIIVAGRCVFCHF
jgi:hypothetical protein